MGKVLANQLCKEQGCGSLPETAIRCVFVRVPVTVRGPGDLAVTKAEQAIDSRVGDSETKLPTLVSTGSFQRETSLTGFPVSPVGRRPTQRPCEEVVCVRDDGQQEPHPAGPPTTRGTCADRNSVIKG